MAAERSHQTVMLAEATELLLVDSDGVYVDGTFGRGGHARRILAALGDQGRLLALDKDPEAIAAGRPLSADPRLRLVQASFARLGELVAEEGLTGRVSGVLLDLGVSSPQLDDPQRGFSFSQDGPLDMRMNPREGQSAADWLATAPERELADVFFRYGEERHSRRIARAIVRAREQENVDSTGRLAAIVKEAHPAWEKHKHPATRVFQAIRIYLNAELDELRRCLDQVLDVLRIGGRLVVISFHSLEDRMVKQFINRQVSGDDFPPGVPVREDELRPRLKRIGKARKAAAPEVDGNPRARSAILRAAEKIA